MAMLAEKRKRTKYCLNPNGNIWKNDNNKFGQKMLEKMGWQKGQGLGANNQGITERLKIAYKFDSSGLGFKEKDVLIQHQSDFQNFLSELNQNSDADGQLQHSVTSLEEKSRTIKSRVHYKKFLRGKDISRYSDKDLTGILGTWKPLCDSDSKSDTNQTNSERNLIYGGPMDLYFEKLKSNSTCMSQSDNNSNLESNSDSYVKKKKHKKLKVEKKEKMSDYDDHIAEKFGIEEIEISDDKRERKKLHKKSKKVKFEEKNNEIFAYEMHESEKNNFNNLVHNNILDYSFEDNASYSPFEDINEQNELLLNGNDFNSEKTSKKRCKKRKHKLSKINSDENLFFKIKFSDNELSVEHSMKKKKICNDSGSDENVLSSEEKFSKRNKKTKLIDEKRIEVTESETPDVGSKEHKENSEPIQTSQETMINSKKNSYVDELLKKNLKEFKKYAVPDCNDFVGSNLHLIKGYGH